LIEVTLALRVFAMYGFNRRVFASLAAAAVVTITLGAVGTVISLIVATENFRHQWSTVGFETIMDIDLPGCHVATVNAQ
jgi:cell division protein FtsX